MVITPADLPTPKLHEYLLNAVAPRPIAFVSTIDNAGRFNLSPFSFFNVFGANPPILVFSPARSGRTGVTKHTHDNVLEVPECVVNIAHLDILHQMNLAAGMYDKGVDEFVKSGLTPVPAEVVRAPRVAECKVSFECKVLQVIETGTGGGAGNLVICEVVKIHIHDSVLDAEGKIDPMKMQYVARMGSQWWCTVNETNMFQVAPFKMGADLGIGFDQLPESVRCSPVLDANELAQLASVRALPTEKELFATRGVPEIDQAVQQFGHDISLFTKEMHELARVEIAQENLDLAWKMLMIAEYAQHPPEKHV